MSCFHIYLLRVTPGAFSPEPRSVVAEAHSSHGTHGGCVGCCYLAGLPDNLMRQAECTA